MQACVAVQEVAKYVDINVMMVFHFHGWEIEVG
jgi:hypothetical protein